MSKPAVLIIPASYSLLSMYQSLIDDISKAGHEVKGIPSATVGPRPQEGHPYAAPSMYDDAANIAKEVEHLAGEGKDVVLIGHSYAGIPMSQSTKGLSKAERQKEGKAGGVIHIGYIASLVPSLGQSAATLMATSKDAQMPSVEIDEHGWMSMSDLKHVASFVCQDLPEAEGEAFAGRFAKHSARSFADELTHAGYADVSASWLLCEEDKSVPVALQRATIDVIEKSSGRSVNVTSIKAGHCPNISQPQATNDWALKLLSQLN